MIGRRIRDFDDPIIFQPGDYGYWGRAGGWYALCPSSDEGAMANLTAHQVTEHEDGTITVSPSIEVSSSRRGADGKTVPYVVYHGWLERGVWRSA